MPEPPSATEKTAANDEYTYDFVQAQQIIEAMDFLREEAVKTRIPEVIAMVDASFRLRALISNTKMELSSHR